MVTVHHFKTWPCAFMAVESGWKRHEVRRLTDREDVNSGDRIILREWIEREKRYTGRWIECLACYISYPEMHEPAASEHPHYLPLQPNGVVITIVLLRQGDDFEADLGGTSKDTEA